MKICTIQYPNSCIVSYDSVSVSEFYCNGTDEYTHYPYDCHLYIRCVGLNVYVNNCAAQKCPIFINGTLNHCNSDKCSELCP